MFLDLQEDLHLVSLKNILRIILAQSEKNLNIEAEQKIRHSYKKVCVFSSTGRKQIPS